MITPDASRSSSPSHLAFLICLTSAAAVAEDARWWTEMPDKALFAVVPNLSLVQPHGTRITGTLQPGDVDGVPALIAAKHIYSTVTVPQPAPTSPCSIEAIVRFAPSTIVELFTTTAPDPAGDSGSMRGSA